MSHTCLTHFFAAVILCNFEDGMCDWKSLSDDKLYKFSRKKSEQLGNQDLPGPDGSVNDESTFFMYAGHKMLLMPAILCSAYMNHVDSLLTDPSGPGKS